MKISACRSCNSHDFAPIFDFGEQVIANHFHKKNDPECLPLPLNLMLCDKCGLAQLADKTDVDLMYRNYWYQSGINQSMRGHLKGLADQVLRRIEIGPEDCVIDIGCNDGTFLGYFQSAGTRIGVDPSNIRPAVSCEYVNDYFTYDAVKPVLKGKKANLITSIAMFYDLNDPAAFVRDIRAALADDGMWVAELSYLPIMIENTAYDSVCHEHVAYYRMGTFMKVLEGTDLVPVHVQLNQMNGGSFRVFMVPNGSSDATVAERLEDERRSGYDGREPYNKFSDGVKRSSDKLVRFLEGNKGKVVYGYGASTKGQVIMQYCHVGPQHLRAIAERNPLKYGLYTPGTNVPICDEDEMRAAKPDYLVFFPWYFLHEFIDREKALHEQGTKFVIPLPQFSTV